MVVSRRKWLARALVYGTPATAFAYGSAIEKSRLAVNELDIPLSPRFSGLEGLKIALMGDFHHDDWGSDALVLEAVDAVNRRAVDLVFLVGDYITEHVSAMEPLCSALSGLRSRLGTCAVLGNHDSAHFDSAIPRLLRESGIRLLVNETLEHPEFTVAGIDSVVAGRPDLPFALKGVASDKPVILGWHEPDTFDTYDDPRVALQLSGHTHGGQIRAPFFGALLLPAHGKKYVFGHFRENERSLYVTRGIGTVDIPARFLCRPELAILTLTQTPRERG